MKAILCNAFGPPEGLKYGEVDVPQVQDDEVLIRVCYCGVNFPDTLIVQGKYQFRPDFPFSPGGEISGYVHEAGQNVHHVRKGDRVVAAMGWGGFAEYAVAKGTNTFEVPDEVPLDQAAILLETYATAIYALKDRAMLKSGETLLVLGASGGTGTAAVQLGRLFGTKVIGVASTEEKRNFVQENGAHLVLGPDEGLKNQLKELGGVDVVFDPVGGKLAEEVFRAINPNGRHLVVGFASGDIPAIPFNLPLLKNASVVGVFWGAFWRNHADENRTNVRMLLKWLKERKLRPVVTKKLSLEKGAGAIRELMDRKAVGKIVLEVDPG